MIPVCSSNIFWYCIAKLPKTWNWSLDAELVKIICGFDQFVVSFLKIVYMELFAI